MELRIEDVLDEFVTCNVKLNSIQLKTLLSAFMVDDYDIQDLPEDIKDYIIKYMFTSEQKHRYYSSDDKFEFVEIVMSIL